MKKPKAKFSESIIEGIFWVLSGLILGIGLVAWMLKEIFWRKNCPLCGRKVSNGKRYGHINTGNAGPHGHLYRTRCPHCDVMLHRCVFGRADPNPEWSSSNVERDELVQKLEPKDVDRITQKIARYSHIKKKWEQFVAQRKPGDELWRYKHGPMNNVGVTIRRGDHLIGNFGCFDAIFGIKVEANEIDGLIKDFHEMLGEAPPTEGLPSAIATKCTE